jgi:hypothetical protein
MHLVGAVFALLGAWMIVAVPVALLVGRFLRVGSERRPAPAAHPLPDDSFGSTAA